MRCARRSAVASVAVAVAGVIALAGIAPAFAQPRAPEPRRILRQRPPLRIEITPRFVRKCEGGYDIERRATGDTVVPRLRCRWAPAP